MSIEEDVLEEEIQRNNIVSIHSARQSFCPLCNKKTYRSTHVLCDNCLDSLQIKPRNKGKDT